MAQKRGLTLSRQIFANPSFQCTEMDNGNVGNAIGNTIPLVTLNLQQDVKNKAVNDNNELQDEPNEAFDNNDL